MYYKSDDHKLLRTKLTPLHYKKIAPCPFCGGWVSATEHIWNNGQGCIKIHCDNCGVDMWTKGKLDYDLIEIAVKKWNRRTRI